jgi:alpha-beta hydrolase superfamily lysophospholipase
VANFITDVEFPFTNIDICNGCQGEYGFWTAWTAARSQIRAAVTSAATANPSYKIVVTGHSLGGAIAAFCAADLRNAGHVVDLVG